MQRAEVGHYIKVVDQYSNFEYEGLFLAESTTVGWLRSGDITVLITKVLKETNPGQGKVGQTKILPKPRYTPVFIKELTETEKLLYVEEIS